MMIPRRFFLTAICHAVLFWLGFGQMVALAGPIERAEAAIQAIDSLQADFTQIASDGSAASGKIYLRRPFQMRIDYDGSTPISLLATRVWLHIDDPYEKTVTSYPISETPLALLLQEDVKLQGDDFTTKVQETGGITQILMRRDTGDGAGTLVLEFDNNFRLRKWIIEDAVGVSTAVTLQNEIYGLKLDNRLFATPSYSSDS